VRSLSPNIARKCNVRACKCMDALANSEAKRRNLEPTVCVGTMGPTQTVGDDEKGHGRHRSLVVRSQKGGRIFDPRPGWSTAKA
jgi:hypothetical protein